MTPHLLWSATTTRRRPDADERPVRVGLEDVGGREAGVRIHAVDAHEHQVDVDRPQRGDRERADERVRRRPHAAR